ncbi:MAG: polymer-forming cytoskeletal protein [Polaromonas sp.]|nr:polymer-forming cytoskeletal protein [Polaromonas sp.]
MATPFFGKRDLDTPASSANSTHQTNLRHGAAQGYGVSGPSGIAPQPTPPVAKPLSDTAASMAQEGGSKLTVGPNIKLKGVEITDCDTLVVEGLVEATMDSRVMQIAEQGAFKGSAEIDVAEIRGEFNGNLTVRQKLVIYSTGKVTGTIRYGKLVIEEGGQLAGEILFGALGKPPALTQVATLAKTA